MSIQASTHDPPTTIDENEELLKLKEEVEARTGKKYKIREPRKNINELLLIGAVQDAPTSLWESFKMAVILLILFLGSFALFHYLSEAFPPKHNHSKSKLFQPKPNQNAQHQQMYQMPKVEPIQPIYGEEF